MRKGCSAVNNENESLRNEKKNFVKLDIIAVSKCSSLRERALKRPRMAREEAVAHTTFY